MIVLAPKCLKLCNIIKHSLYFHTICSKPVLFKQEVFMCKNFKKWLFIISVVKKILLGVANEAVLLRITNVHLDIKQSLH